MTKLPRGWTLEGHHRRDHQSTHLSLRCFQGLTGACENLWLRRPAFPEAPLGPRLGSNPASSRSASFFLFGAVVELPAPSLSLLCSPKASLLLGSLRGPLAETPNENFIFTVSSSFQLPSFTQPSVDIYKALTYAQPVLGAGGGLEGQVGLSHPTPKPRLATDNILGPISLDLSVRMTYTCMVFF